MESRQRGGEPNHRAARARHTHQEPSQTRSHRSLGPQLLRARRAFDQDCGYGGRSTPRVPFLWSLGQEPSYERTHVDRVQYCLTRDAFRDIAPLPDAASGSTLDTSLGRLLGDYMIAWSPGCRPRWSLIFPRLIDAVGAMVAAAVAPSADWLAVARRQIDVGRKERVRQIIRKHLRPDLQADGPVRARWDLPIQPL